MYPNPDLIFFILNSHEWFEIKNVRKSVKNVRKKENKKRNILSESFVVEFFIVLKLQTLLKLLMPFL